MNSQNTNPTHLSPTMKFEDYENMMNETNHPLQIFIKNNENDLDALYNKWQVEQPNPNELLLVFDSPNGMIKYMYSNTIIPVSGEIVIEKPIELEQKEPILPKVKSTPKPDTSYLRGVCSSLTI